MHKPFCLLNSGFERNKPASLDVPDVRSNNDTMNNNNKLYAKVDVPRVSPYR